MQQTVQFAFWRAKILLKTIYLQNNLAWKFFKKEASTIILRNLRNLFQKILMSWAFILGYDIRLNLEKCCHGTKNALNSIVEYLQPAIKTTLGYQITCYGRTLTFLNAPSSICEHLKLIRIYFHYSQLQYGIYRDPKSVLRNKYTKFLPKQTILLPYLSLLNDPR